MDQVDVLRRQLLDQGNVRIDRALELVDGAVLDVEEHEIVAAGTGDHGDVAGAREAHDHAQRRLARAHARERRIQGHGCRAQAASFSGCANFPRCASMRAALP